MKIDNIINDVKSTTNEFIIITNAKTIKSFFDEINLSSVFVPFKKECKEKVQSVYRRGVTIHFVNEEYINKDCFSNLMEA